MNTVEKVARALYFAALGVALGDSEVTERDKARWEANWSVWRAHYSPMARAAIEAMREPGEAMLDKGPGEPYMDRDVWARMIDASLREGDG
jgi:hypothetical protein